MHIILPVKFLYNLNALKTSNVFYNFYDLAIVKHTYVYKYVRILFEKFVVNISGQSWMQGFIWWIGLQ